MSMGKIDPNHDIVPTLRMMGGLLFDKAADEIDLLREAYRAAVRRPATELMVVGPGWHERFPVTTTPIVIDGLLQVHVSDRRDDMAAELARLRAENERLKAGAARFQWMLDNPAHESMPFTTADGQWCVQFSVVAGGLHRRYYKTLDAAIDAAMAQGKS